jgi:hypothetical protein
MLKYIITEEADLPAEEATKALYSKEGEQWILQVEGAVPKKQHDEFRTANIELRKKVEAFGDADPAAVSGMQKKIDDLEASAGGDKDKITAQVEKRVKEMQVEHTAKTTALEGNLSTANSQLDVLTIDRDLLEAAGKFGLRDSAHADLVGRGRSVFKREDGKIVAFDSEGEKAFGPSGDALTTDDFVKGLLKSAGHLFDESKGSGAGGSGAGGKGGATGVNPWKNDTFSLTDQGKMLRSQPELARQMAAAAGKVIDPSPGQ